MSAYPTRAQFTENMGTTFTADTAGGPYPLVLDAVRAGYESEGYAPFSVEFSGEGEPLSQATYSIAHDALGTHAIFIVPVAREGTRTIYEAVFNVAKGSEG
ncbi:MAG: hypothetical protein Q7W30_05955 [Coriobacteriia bacterium]|nr:hypothetical protein [Coriobacteriia bacterium]